MSKLKGGKNRSDHSETRKAFIFARVIFSSYLLIFWRIFVLKMEIKSKLTLDYYIPPSQTPTDKKIKQTASKNYFGKRRTTPVLGHSDLN